MTVARPGPLRLTELQRHSIIEHCRRDLPFEACGLVFGIGDRAELVSPMRNAARSTTFYHLDPAEQLREMEGARERGLDLVAIFHSHPVTRPYPSQTDIDFAGFWHDCWFLIASFRAVTDEGGEPELCAYRIVGEEVHDTGIEMVDDPG